MENEELIKKICSVYTSIVKKTTDPDFQIPYCLQTKKAIQTYITELLKETGGVLNGNRIVDYCIFQAYYYRNKDEYKYKWNVSWSFSLKAIERFKSSKSGMRFYENIWLQDAGMERNEFYPIFVDNSQHPKLKFLYMPSEENTKRLNLNTEIGYVRCSWTTMWSPLSEACNQCNYQSECKNRLKKFDFELFRLRELESNKTKI